MFRKPPDVYYELLSHDQSVIFMLKRLKSAFSETAPTLDENSALFFKKLVYKFKSDSIRS